MAPSSHARTNATVTLTMLGLIAAFVAANQSPSVPSTGLYAVAADQPTVRFQNPAALHQRAVLAVTNMDSTASRVVTLHEISETSNATALLTPLSSQDPSTPPEPAEATLPTRSQPTEEPPETRRFVVHNGDGPFNDPRFFQPVTAQRVGFNECVAVFAHPAAEPPTPGSIDQLLTIFSEQHEAVAKLFGSRAVDIDGDDRFCVLLVPKPNRNSPTAFVRPADFTPATSSLSNRADILYLSSERIELEALRTLIAHEYAHAICCSLRPEAMEEDWLHEAIAHLAERLSGSSTSNVDHRISRFLENTHRYPLVVPDYFAAGLYREHGCRGATATFLDSVNRRCSGSEGLLPVLAKSNSTGVRNIGSAADKRFPAILRGWTQDLMRSEAKPHTLGGFVIIGPKPVPITGEPLELSIAPTATVFVELTSSAYELAIEGSIPPQATVYVSDSQPALSIASNIHNSGEVEITIESPTETQRLVCGAETVVEGKTESLGLRETKSPNGPTTYWFKSGVKDHGPITIKAYAELSDGTIRTGRTNLSPTSIQLTGRPEKYGSSTNR